MKRGKTGQTDHLTLVKRPENQEIPQNQCARVTTRKEINKKSHQTLAKHHTNQEMSRKKLAKTTNE